MPLIESNRAIKLNYGEEAPSEDCDEEVFEDATDENYNENLRPPTLEESIEEVVQLLDLALNNKFERALKLTERWASVSLYHALGKATLCFLKGLLTLERQEIQRAMEALRNVIEICYRKRKQSNSVTKVVWRPNYNNYTDDEVHVELCFAESQLEIALLTFLEDQNLVSLVKGAFRIRSCYQSYKECNQILANRTKWESESSRKHFESGVRMGIGTFNLMISHLPTKVLRLLEFVGFSGNRSVGFRELEASADMTEGLRSPLGSLILMAYHCYVEHLFGLGDCDLAYVDNLVSRCLKKYPSSAFFLLFAGRTKQLQGKMDKAIDTFNECINLQNEWKQIHNICYWELLWCHAVHCNWREAAHYADILRKQCNWSKATYTYQYASFLYMIAEEEDKKELKEEVDRIIATVPSLRQRYAGKTVPAEKFAITRSERYTQQGHKLVLPAIELLYIWNVFAIMDNAKHLVTPMLNVVERCLLEYRTEKDLTDHPVDNYALVLLLKGICLRLLNFPLQAEECFMEVLRLEKRIQINTFVPPHAAMEIGLTHIKMKECATSRQWLEKARRDYTGYLLETIVHFRVHCALRTIKIMEKERKSSKVSPSQSSEDFETSQVYGKRNGAVSAFQQMARRFRSRDHRDMDDFLHESQVTKL